MSFRCDHCNKPQPHGTAPLRRVMQTRDKDYHGGGRGWEIAKEANLCKPCVDRGVGAAPQQVA